MAPTCAFHCFRPHPSNPFDDAADICTRSEQLYREPSVPISMYAVSKKRDTAYAHRFSQSHLDDLFFLFRTPFLLMPSPQRVLGRRDLESDPRVQLVLLPTRGFLYPLPVFPISTLLTNGGNCGRKAVAGVSMLPQCVLLLKQGLSWGMKNWRSCLHSHTPSPTSSPPPPCPPSWLLPSASNN